MASSPRRPCAHPGCTALVVSGRCEQHTRAPVEMRPSAAMRGYNRQWNQYKKMYLKRHPFCHDCLARGVRNIRDREVHHIKKVADYPELQYVEANCMTLCKSCHSARTARGE